MLGSVQWGLVTTAQARGAGVSRVALGRLAGRGSVRRVRHGVYALPSAGFGPLQDVRAAWLATDPARGAEQRVADGAGVVVSHASAAVVHGLGDLVAARHEFTAPGRRQTSQPDLRFHKGVVAGGDRVFVDGLPVTSVVRTVADLAGARLDVDHLAQVVRDGLQVAGGSYAQLATRLDPYAHRYGYGTGRALVEGCLAMAGLPDTAADVLSQTLAPYLAELTRQLAPLAAGMKPLVDEMTRLAPADTAAGPWAKDADLLKDYVAPPETTAAMAALAEAARQAVSSSVPTVLSHGIGPGAVRPRGGADRRSRKEPGDVAGEGDENG